MLVLSRQRDQSIMIGDDVEIKVVDVRGDKVRLGINAPRHVMVHRKEVYDNIRRENEEAGKLQPGDVSSIIDSPPTIRMGPTPPTENDPPPAARPAQDGMAIDALLAKILSLSESDFIELMRRFREQKPDFPRL